MSVSSPPSVSIDRNPEPAMSAGAVNLMTRWVSPALHIRISRVRLCPEAVAMVMRSVAWVVAGSGRASTAAINASAVAYCWAEAVPANRSRALTAATRKAPVLLWWVVCGRGLFAVGAMGAGSAVLRSIGMGGYLLGTAETGLGVAQHGERCRGKQGQGGDADEADRQHHEAAEGGDRHEVGEDQRGEAAAEGERGEHDLPAGGVE